MKIPITQNLSTEVTDLVGYLDIPETLADELAALFGNGLSVRMNACVEQYGDKFTLRHVSIAEGAWRAGYRPDQIVDMLIHKQAVNERRQWPKPTSEDAAIEHIQVPLGG